MKNYMKKRFSLTDQGAEDAVKAIFASFFVYCINMLPAILLMLFVEHLLKEEIKSPYLYLGLSIATLIIMYFLLSYEYEKQYNTTYKESENLRIDIGEKLSNLPMSYFSKHDLSDLSQTIMADVDGIEHAMSHAIPKGGGLLFFIPLISILLLIGNFKMGLAVILPTIISFSVIPLAKKISVRANKKYYDVLRENSEAFQEAIEMSKEINSFNLSDKLKRVLFKKMEESEKIHFRTEGVNMLIMGVSSLFTFINLGLVIFVGSILIIRGQIDILYLIGYLLAAIKIREAIDGSKEFLLEIFYLDPKIERIREIKESQTQKGKDIDLKNFDVELKNVGFSYKEDEEVLKDISFVAKQDEVTALVGPSGCGKTSILRLISRLYDYDKGKILIGGEEIKNISTKALYKNISIVFQDVILFNTSLMENIRIGRESASDEEVIQAAKLANCEFIEKLSEGFNTLIGENGAELSGGERQRISIARAFLKDAPILILDEIAAALDVDNEKKIQESLNRLIKNKTVIIISHRLKSIENVDKIVVMENGFVEGQGRHTDLIKSSKIYRDLIEKTKMAEEFKY